MQATAGISVDPRGFLARGRGVPVSRRSNVLLVVAHDVDAPAAMVAVQSAWLRYDLCGQSCPSTIEVLAERDATTLPLSEN